VATSLMGKHLLNASEVATRGAAGPRRPRDVTRLARRTASTLLD
jgi:hypothetical protein